MRASTVLVVAFLANATAFSAGTPLAEASGAVVLAVRTNDAAGVRVVVKPKAIEAGAPMWEFEITMDTHTKPLSDDLSRVAVLVDGSGRRYLPLAWQGDPPGGHHRKGILRFPVPDLKSGKVELQISGVGGTENRVFQWEIK
jgi:hypothetical protein